MRRGYPHFFLLTVSKCPNRLVDYKGFFGRFRDFYCSNVVQLDMQECLQGAKSDKKYYVCCICEVCGESLNEYTYIPVVGSLR